MLPGFLFPVFKSLLERFGLRPAPSKTGSFELMILIKSREASVSTVSFYPLRELSEEVKKRQRRKRVQFPSYSGSVKSLFPQKEQKQGKEELLRLLKKAFSMQMLEELEEERGKADKIGVDTGFSFCGLKNQQVNALLRFRKLV